MLFLLHVSSQVCHIVQLSATASFTNLTLCLSTVLLVQLHGRACAGFVWFPFLLFSLHSFIFLFLNLTFILLLILVTMVLLFLCSAFLFFSSFFTILLLASSVDWFKLYPFLVLSRSGSLKHCPLSGPPSTSLFWSAWDSSLTNHFSTPSHIRTPTLPLSPCQIFSHTQARRHSKACTLVCANIQFNNCAHTFTQPHFLTIS